MTEETTLPRSSSSRGRPRGSRTHYATPTISTGAADLYNCRTRQTTTCVSMRAAKEHATRMRRADKTQVDWILMGPDGDLYRSELVTRHCGRAGVLGTLTWREFKPRELTEKMKPTE